MAPRAATAQDVVIVQSRDQQSERRVAGTVLDYTGRRLVLKHASGREENIPASRVVQVHGEWTQVHREANTSFAEGDYEHAVDRYRQALRAEQRRWVQRRILAQLTWCYRYLGEPAEAVQAFLPLYQDDRTTPHFDAMPLTWITHEPDQSIQGRATGWLESTNSAAQLIGASWLLSSAQRGKARRVLRRLAADPDPRIVFLAEAQLWRTEVATANEQAVNRWQTRIDKMPVEIRCGPYFVLGLALGRQAKHELAALAFMRVVIMYGTARDLAPHALLASGRELEKIGQHAAAATLYRELLVDFATSNVVPDAESRLEELVGQ